MRKSIWILGLVILGSCSGAKMVKDSTKKCFPLRMDRDEYAAADYGNIKIRDIQIEGKCLTIAYELKNACEDSDIDLHWDYRVKKSLPPQASLRINQTGKRNCDLQLKGKKKFDLNELTNPAYKGKIFLTIPPHEEKFLFEYQVQQ